MKLNPEQRAKLAATISVRRAAQASSDAELGRAVGVHPSQVGRICRGDFRTMSANVVQVCKALGIETDTLEGRLPEIDRGWARLEAAVRAAWDNTPKGADDLARVIEALAVLRKSEV